MAHGTRRVGWRRWNEIREALTHLQHMVTAHAMHKPRSGCGLEVYRSPGEDAHLTRCVMVKEAAHLESHANDRSDEIVLIGACFFSLV
jgi:hypothetical protein